MNAIAHLCHISLSLLLLHRTMGASDIQYVMCSLNFLFSFRVFLSPFLTLPLDFVDTFLFLLFLGVCYTISSIFKWTTGFALMPSFGIWDKLTGSNQIDIGMAHL